MAEPIGSLRVEMAAGWAELKADLGKAFAAVNTFGNRTKVSMDGVSRSFSRGLRSFSAGSLGFNLSVTGVVLGMAALVKTAMKTEAEMYNLGQRYGIATDQLSLLAYSAKLADVDIEQLAKGLRLLNSSSVAAAKSGSEAAKAFRSIGIDPKSLYDAGGHLKPLTERFMLLADAMGAMADGGVKGAASNVLLGKTGDALIPMFNKLAAGIRAEMDEARSLGMEVLPAAAKAADELDGKTNKLKGRVTGLGRSIANDLIPYLLAYTKAVTDAKAAGHGWLASLFIAGNVRFDAGLTEQQKAAKKLTDARKELEAAYTGLAAAQAHPTLAKVLQTQGPAEARQEMEVAKARYRAAQSEVLRLAAVQKKADEDEAERLRKKQDLADETARKLEKDEQDRLAQIDADAEAERAKKAAAADALRAAEAALKAGDQAIEAALRERDVREGATDAQKRQFELEKGELQGLNRLRTEGTPAQQAEATKRIELLALLDEYNDRMKDLAASKERDAEATDADLAAATTLHEENLTALERYHLRLQEISDLRAKTKAGTWGPVSLLSDADVRRAQAMAKATYDAAVATDVYEERMKALTAQVAEGTITHGEYRDAMNALTADMEGVAAAMIRQWEAVDEMFRGWTDRATDALVDFAMTGKLAFRSLANSIIADILRMQIRMGMMKLFPSLFGSLAIGAAGGWAGVASGASGSIFSTGPGFVGFARGGTAKPGSIHEVAEEGPEMLSSGGRHYLMMGQQSGRVTPLGKAVGGEAPPLRFEPGQLADLSGIMAAGMRQFLEVAGRGAYAPPDVGARETGAAEPPQVNLRVVNLSDRDEVPGWVATHPGERAILNLIGRNATQLRAILRP